MALVWSGLEELLVSFNLSTPLDGNHRGAILYSQACRDRLADREADRQVDPDNTENRQTEKQTEGGTIKVSDS